MDKIGWEAFEEPLVVQAMLEARGWMLDGAWFTSATGDARSSSAIEIFEKEGGRTMIQFQAEPRILVTNGVSGELFVRVSCLVIRDDVEREIRDWRSLPLEWSKSFIRTDYVQAVFDAYDQDEETQYFLRSIVQTTCGVVRAEDGCSSVFVDNMQGLAYELDALLSRYNARLGDGILLLAEKK